MLASVLGLPHLGLSDLLGGLVNVHVAKGTKRALQQSDWRQRPLDAVQFRYAAADAGFLPMLLGSLLVVAWEALRVVLPETVACERCSIMFILAILLTWSSTFRTEFQDEHVVF